MVALVKGRRAEDRSVIDYEVIDQDVWEFYDSRVKRKGTDVPQWISIMTEHSMCHLQKLFERYKSYSPHDMSESMKKEVKRDLRNAFLNLIPCIQNNPLYFADQLYDSKKGKETHNKVLFRIMVSNSEVDTLKIRSELKKKSTASPPTTPSRKTPRGTIRRRCYTCVVWMTEACISLDIQ